MKCINRTFEDAYRSPISVVILDDLERLLEYTPIGPRFSNTVLQTLMVLVKKAPPPNHKLFVIATTSNAKVMNELDIVDQFTMTMNVPDLSTDEVCHVIRRSNLFHKGDIEEASELVCNKTASLRLSIPIKRLMFLLDSARNECGQLRVDRLKIDDWERLLDHFI